MNQLRNILISRREGIMERCSNPNNTNYKRYGGRGITMCQEWVDSPQAFVDWALANGFSPELQIDRIDNDKGYSPDNCRWVTARDNMRNRSVGVLTAEQVGQARFLIQIEEVTVNDIAEYLGVKRTTLNVILTPNSIKWADVEPIPIDIPEVIMKNISARLEAKQVKYDKVSEKKQAYLDQFAQWELRAAHIRYEREVLKREPKDIRAKYNVGERIYYEIMSRKKFPNIQPLKP